MKETKIDFKDIEKEEEQETIASRSQKTIRKRGAPKKKGRVSKIVKEVKKKIKEPEPNEEDYEEPDEDDPYY